MTTEEKIEQVKDFRPIDDVFFEAMASGKEGIGVCEEILRVIMQDEKLVVIDVIVQSSERNIYGRSVRLDALCVLGTGERVNIEVQRSDNDDHLRRARFNASSITVKDSNTGEHFEDIVDVYVVYISQFDIFKGGLSLYHIDKVVRETGQTVNDGSYFIFVNTESNDGSDVAALMQCFLQKDVNNPMFPRFSNRVRELKSTEGGATVVCEIQERYQAKAVAEASIKTAIKTAIKYGANRKAIVDDLVQEYGLTETEAIAKIKQYAPSVA